MIESLLKLCLPMLVAAIFYFREYGVTDTKYFKGWGSIRLAAMLLFLGHLGLLIFHGEEWFCGSCRSKFRTDTFLIPSLGYSLLAFPSLFSGNVFDSPKEKIAEFIVSLIGLIFILYGAITTIGY